MTETKIVARLVEFGPRVIASAAKPGPRCVLATRIGLEVLAALAIQADCTPVVLEVTNTAFARWDAEGQPGGRDEFLARGCWRLTNEPSDDIPELPYSGIPVPTRARWPGHLVVTARGRLIDLDLGQTARQRYHISPPDGLAVRWDGLGAVADFPWGCVRYRPWPPCAPLPEFHGSPDWRADVRHVTGRVLRAVRRGAL